MSETAAVKGKSNASPAKSSKKKGAQGKATSSESASSSSALAPSPPSTSSSDQSHQSDETDDAVAAATTTTGAAGSQSLAQSPSPISIETLHQRPSASASTAPDAADASTAAHSALDKYYKDGQESGATCGIPFFSGNPVVELTKGVLHIFCDRRRTPSQHVPGSGASDGQGDGENVARSTAGPESASEDLKKSLSGSTLTLSTAATTAATTTNASTNHTHGYSVFDDSAAKEVQLSGVLFGSIPAFAIPPGGSASNPKKSIIVPLPKNRSRVIAILAVPSTLGYTDLLQFTAPAQQTIDHMRIIRDGAPNRYLAVLSFVSQEAADEFYVMFNDRQFNSLEPERCHLAFVSHIHVTHRTDMEAFLFEMETRVQSASSDAVASPLTTPLSVPTALTAAAADEKGKPAFVELPTCPVCLERLDETASGVFTTLCNHNFHCNCLSGWKDGSCPICRYCIQPDNANQCFKCECTQSLWICLICAHIGCGRYVDGHAYKHFLETQHTYAMELETQRVWDYAGDNYVHRLIQSKTDGKVVAFPAPKPHSLQPHAQQEASGLAGGPASLGGASGRGIAFGDFQASDTGPAVARSRKDPDKFGFGNSEVGEKTLHGAYANGHGSSQHSHGQSFYEYSSSEEKVDSIQLEYTYLLTSQLEKQRKYFMARIAETEAQSVDYVKALEEKVSRLAGQYEELATRVSAMDKEKKALEKKCTQLKEKQKKLEEDLDLERQLNASLQEHKNYWSKELEETKKKSAEALKQKEKEIADLNEQVRDLMFYMDTQQKVAQSPQSKELQEGRLVITETASSSTPSPGKGKKRR